MEDRVKLTKDEVDGLLTPGENVHTFKSAGPAILGCDVDRDRILSIAEEYGAELSGQMATSMKHGVVVWDGEEPMFCETINL